MLLQKSKIQKLLILVQISKKLHMKYCKNCLMFGIWHPKFKVGQGLIK